MIPIIILKRRLFELKTRSDYPLPFTKAVEKMLQPRLSQQRGAMFVPNSFAAASSAATKGWWSQLQARLWNRGFLLEWAF